MSQEELVGAYVDGLISRRTLIRRLVAGGVSLGAASAYAQLLAPEAHAGGGVAGGGHGSPEYGKVFVNIHSDDLGKVIDDEALKVKMRSAEVNEMDGGAGTFELVAYRGKSRLGDMTVSFPKPGSQNVSIPLDTVDPLFGSDRARVKVIAFFYPQPGKRFEMTRRLKILSKKKKKR